MNQHTGSGQLASAVGLHKVIGWSHSILQVLHQPWISLPLPQRVGAELQARVQGEFRALQQFLQEEEACVLEQMRREQREVTDKLQRHLEDSREAVKELEQNIRALQQAFAASENTTPTEVSVNPVQASATY